MRVAIAGPIDLRPLRLTVGPPVHYSFPLLGELAAGLRERGHDVCLVTTSAAISEPWAYSEPNCSIVILPDQRRFRKKVLTRHSREIGLLASTIDGFDADLVNAHWTNSFALGSLASQTPTLVTVHDWAPTMLTFERTVDRFDRLSMQRRVLRSGCHLVAVSPYIADHIERATRRSVPVVPNGLRFPTSPAAKPGLSEFSVGALNQGFDKRKNVSTLLQSWALLQQTLPNARLVLAGRGYGEGEAAHQWATQHKLAERVAFLGELPPERVGEFLRSLDVFVHPSLEESFGMVIIEALREGTPVIAGKCSGGVPWVLNSAAEGTLVDVTSPSALAEAVTRMSTDRALRLSAGLDGFASVRTRFSLRQMIDGYEQQYERLLEVRR